jgi:hypothetical protein
VQISSSLKLPGCQPVVSTNDLTPNVPSSLDFISSQSKHFRPPRSQKTHSLTLPQRRIWILGSYVAIIVLSAKKACDSRWLGPSNVRSIHWVVQQAFSSMSHCGKTRQRSFNVQLGMSAVVWSGGSRPDCQVQVLPVWRSCRYLKFRGLVTNQCATRPMRSITGELMEAN